MKELKDMKEGDWVFHVIAGWEKLTTQHQSLVGKTLSTPAGTYNLDGRFSKNNKFPTIYPANPFDPSDMPPCEFKVGEVVAVRDGEGCEWEYDKFLTMRPKHNDLECSGDYWGMARKLTPAERGQE